MQCIIYNATQDYYICLCMASSHTLMQQKHHNMFIIPQIGIQLSQEILSALCYFSRQILIANLCSNSKPYTLQKHCFMRLLNNNNNLISHM